MSIRAAALLTVLCALSGCAREASPDAPRSEPAKTDQSEAGAPNSATNTVTLSAEQVEKLGLRVKPATEISFHAQAEGYAQVWSHEPIAQLLSDLATATAAQRQSAAALKRLQSLSQSPGAYTADAVESAEQRAAADESAVMLAKNRLSAFFGADHSNSLDGVILDHLASGHLKLVRVTFPIAAEVHAVPTTLRLQPAFGSTHQSPVIHARFEAPADPAVPGYSIWVVASGSGLAEGTRLTALAPTGPALHGALVPSSAVVVSDDRYWCLVEGPQGTFTRIAMTTDYPAADGYGVSGSIKAGAAIVVSGAGELLAQMTGGGADSGP